MLARRHFLLGSIALATSYFTPISSELSALAAPIKGVSYGPQKLDIYPTTNQSRAGEAGLPIVIFVHGGAWRAGNKSRVGAKARYFTKRGYLFISVGYTKYPAAKATRQANQVGQAVNWVRANAPTYGGDPSRIVLMGHSAGSHLAALATLSGKAGPVAGLICNDTRAYDLPFLARRNGGRVPTLYSALREKKNWAKWSPITYVSVKAQPPTLVAWSGGKGRDVISLNFVNALRNAGVSVTPYDGSNRYNHLSINSRMGNETGGVTSAVARFIEQRIG